MAKVNVFKGSNKSPPSSSKMGAIGLILLDSGVNNINDPSSLVVSIEMLETERLLEEVVVKISLTK